MLFELLKAAADDLACRPLRTVLTVTGFAASMAIATILLAAGGGLERAIRGILLSLGEGQIVATAGRTTGIGGVRRSGRTVRIRFDDLGGIEAALPSFAGAASYFDLRGGGASSWRYSVPWSPVRAVSRGYLEVRRLPITEGRWFTSREHDEGAWVAVLNEGLRAMIFRDHTAVGQWIEWRGRRMEVVGVVRDEVLFPYILFVPYRTVSQNMADARYVTAVIARPAPGSDWEQAVGELRRALGGLGGFDPRDENALEIETNHEFTSLVRTVSTAFRALVLTIALVSLLLGALGVANMVSITVTERTRELGLRMALGATTRLVWGQVLIEAALLAFTGGGAGLGLGAAACLALDEMPISPRYTVALSLTPLELVVSFAALASASALAALIPARRAARLSPAEALRWE
jgi:putative ABC transport system permease protein